MIFFKYFKSVLAVGIALYHIYVLSLGTFDLYSHRVLSVLFLQLLIFLTTSSNLKPRVIKHGVDVFTLILWGISAAYFIPNLGWISMRTLGIDPLYLKDYVIGVIFLILVLESARRHAGIWLPIFSIIFITYIFVAPYIPGLFHRTPMEFEELIERLVFSTDGVFSFPAAVASTYVFLFVLFGQFLGMVGGGKFFFDFAGAIAGRSKGGAAKVAIISSGLFGMISGSPAADVVTTGSFTIPAMKKCGIPGVYAAAVESVACVGGSLMPPVMGSVAFLMADILGLPYLAIVKAAIAPALIYYFSLYFMVHLEAKRLRLSGYMVEDIVPLGKVMTYSAGFLVPLSVIVILLVWGYTPIRAALGAIISTILVGIAKPQPDKGRLKVKHVLDALEQGSLGNRTVNSACACAGIMAGVIIFSGMGGKVGSAMMSMAGESFIPTLIVAMLASVIIGTGVTVSATYILTALLLVPAAVKVGIPALAAHFFVFQFAVLSHITPPVAVPPYIAAGIAGEDPMRCGFAAWRFSIVTFMIPFLYIYEPGLLLIGTLPEIVRAITKAVGATVLLDCGIAGYMLSETRLTERLLCIVGGIAMLYSGITVPAIGIAFGMAALISQKWGKMGFGTHRSLP